jgi:hypothetical protein
MPADRSHLVDRTMECSFVGPGWLVEAADLPDELQRGRVDLVVRDRRLEVE